MAIRIVDKKRFMLVIAIIAVLLGLLIFFGVKFFSKESGNGKSEKRIYEALVQPFDQEKDSSNETNDTSLKKGDVIVIFPEGHPWSESEKTSYLILKLRLTEDDANKLIEAETEEIQGTNAEEGRGPETRTIRARKYRIKIESLNFDLQKFWENPVQPYADKVFDKNLIETN
jgi:hypothetical protein